MRTFTIAFTLACSLIACGPTVQYIGKSYSPTANVDVYFDTHDVKKNYTVMGKMEGVSGVFGDGYDAIQAKIVQEAKTRGADGVILYNMEQRVVATSTNSNTSWNTSQSNHRQWLDKSGAAATTSISQNITENVLHADFIKYDN